MNSGNENELTKKSLSALIELYNNGESQM